MNPEVRHIVKEVAKEYKFDFNTIESFDLRIGVNLLPKINITFKNGEQTGWIKLKSNG